MLVLDYDEIEHKMLSLWEAFIEYMDGQDLSRMGPHGAAVEKTQNFSSVAGTGSKIIPLFKTYLIADNSADLETRCTIFLESLKNAPTLGLMAQMENDPALFSREQSQAFQKKIALQKIFKRHHAEMEKTKHRGETDMNVFFMQYELEKIKNKIHAYDTQPDTYAIVDPLTYLERVASIVLSHSAQQCLNPHDISVAVHVAAPEIEVEPLDVLLAHQRTAYSKKMQTLYMAIATKLNTPNIGTKGPK